MLTIFGALKIELEHLIRKIGVRSIHKEKDIKIYQGVYGEKSIRIVQTGMGPENACRAAELFVGYHNSMHKTKSENPDGEVIVTGFCGAADPGVPVGEIVSYGSIKNIILGEKNDFIEADDIDSSSAVLQKARRDNPFTIVNGATVPMVITEPAQKMNLRERFHIQVIDTETYYILYSIQRLGLPFSCIRVVSDDANSLLPSYFDNSSNKGMALKLTFSILKSIFSKKEFSINRDVFANLKKARASLKEVSNTIISCI